MKASAAIVEILKRKGVDTFFGYLRNPCSKRPSRPMCGTLSCTRKAPAFTWPTPCHA